MGAHNVDEAIEIDGAVTRELIEAGVADSSPIRLSLIHDAEIHDGQIVVPDENGKSVSIRQRLEEMRGSDRFKGQFKPKPAPPGRPPKLDPLNLTPEQFAAVADGKVVVR
jgi:hypothetical protein